MTQYDVMRRLREAKKAHLRWMGRISSMADNSLSDISLIEFSETECAFGKWLIQDSAVFSQNQNLVHQFISVVNLHSELHKIGEDIFKMMPNKNENILFMGIRKISGVIKTRHLSNSHKIKITHKAIKKKSDSLLGALDILEGAISMHGIHFTKYTGKKINNTPKP